MRNAKAFYASCHLMVVNPLRGEYYLQEFEVVSLGRSSMELRLLSVLNVKE